MMEWTHRMDIVYGSRAVFSSYLGNARMGKRALIGYGEFLRKAGLTVEEAVPLLERQAIHSGSTLSHLKMMQDLLVK